jgi:hypothetical protein
VRRARRAVELSLVVGATERAVDRIRAALLRQA